MGINRLRLNDRLRNNPDACVEILEDVGFTAISHVASLNELRFAREEGRNPTAVRFKLETLKYVCFSTNEHGDIYTLIMKEKDCNFPEALEYVAKKLGLSKSSLSSKIKYPFSGFYRGLMKEISEPEYSMKTYDEQILDEYRDKCNLMFLRDGIDMETQQSFGVGYDIESGRITVPEYTLDGKLCGIMGRLNDPHCDKAERWLPIIPCSRNLTLYGYHRNYDTIQQKSVVVIGESEKFVQQLHSMGCYIGLSLCGCEVSQIQAKHIKSLMTDKVILALDEGLPEDQIRAQAEKLITDNALFKNKVGYIFDRENELLPKGSKASPSDFGKDAFQNLYKSHVVWVN